MPRRELVHVDLMCEDPKCDPAFEPDHWESVWLAGEMDPEGDDA